MIDYRETFKPGDIVLFLQPKNIIYDNEGEEVYKHLEHHKEYEVESSYILCIKLKGVQDIYLKENFKKKI